MQYASKGQLRQMFGLLSQNNIRPEERGSLALQYSGGRTEHTSQLYSHEIGQLLTDLDRTDVMRKKMIHYAHLMGWKTDLGKADINRLNEWCMKSGKFKKPLSDHNQKELSALLSQFEIVYKSYLKNL